MSKTLASLAEIEKASFGTATGIVLGNSAKLAEQSQYSVSEEPYPGVCVRPSQREGDNKVDERPSRHARG
jgi:hypothetical protein